MITVSGTPYDISAIYDEYPQNSIESQTLEMMSSSAENYKYDSEDVLKFELRLRKEIVNAAMGLYNSRLAFSVFDKSRCNPMYWNRTDEGGFMLREDVKASDAIRDIYENSRQYATECSTAIMIIYYKALLETLGDDIFDSQFKRIYLMDWATEPIIQNVLNVRNVTMPIIGDGAYISNPDFDPSKPEWQGENVIVLPDSVYYGHGIGIGTADEIIRMLNSLRRPGATRSAYMLDTVNRLDVPKLYNMSRIYSHERTAELPTRTAELPTRTAESPEGTTMLAWGPFPTPIHSA